jgi:predicted P-loop ATPase
MAELPEYVTDSEFRATADLCARVESGVNKPVTRGKAKRLRAPTESADWLRQCIGEDHGRVIPNLANILVALRSAPELAGAIRFDEMQQAPVVVDEVPIAPGRTGARGGTLPRLLRDTDVSQLQEWLQHRGMPKIGREQVYQAVDQRAQKRSFHPVRDYLDGLKWDRVKRLDNWTAKNLGADPSDYAAGIGRMFLIAMVARIYEPGCKADYMLVLEGEQGAGKSRASRVLAGEWFSDGLPDIHHKDAKEHLRGKWLIEIAELSAIGKADAEALKAFISRPIERFRASYGRKEVTEPRQCIFIGTTNKSVYLKDETGARRFWPLKVGNINIDALKRDRDQLFAEAVTAYRNGAKWWPDAGFEREHIKPEQAKRFEADPWEQTIREFVAGRERVNITSVARDALSLDVGKVGTIEQRRISGVLIELGWTSGRDSKGRFYSAPGDAS